MPKTFEHSFTRFRARLRLKMTMAMTKMDPPWACMKMTMTISLKVTHYALHSISIPIFTLSTKRALGALKCRMVIGGRLTSNSIV
eukprot:COSAG02_NODE_17878_length_974_cov_1.021714_1_plen_84_part_10